MEARTCTECGVELARKATGRRRWLCAECRPKVHARRKRAKREANRGPRICKDCPTEVQPTGVDSTGLRLRFPHRCEPCRKARELAMGRARDRAKRAPAQRHRAKRREFVWTHASTKGMPPAKNKRAAKRYAALDQGWKKCTVCCSWLQLWRFPNQPQGLGGKESKCIPCKYRGRGKHQPLGWCHGILVKRQGGVCAYCRRDLAQLEVHADHVIPRAQGGTDDLGNLVAACRRCNLQKGARTPEEWLGQD